MPMVDSLLNQCGQTMDDVDVVAVAAGPGSFTGLRIGVSTAKGLAWAGEKPCAPCSTLESMSWQIAHVDGIIIAAMDARRNQVYNALFRAENSCLERLSPDRAIGLAELEAELKKLPGPKILVGDGAQLCYNEWQERMSELRLAPIHLRAQTAWGVARAALELVREDALIPGEQLVPVYHRLSQAERERLEKEQNKQ